MLFRFGDFELDSAKRLLLRNGGRIPLTPKALDVLLALVERNGETLHKDELLRLVWPDTTVEEISLTRNISVLRKLLGEKPDEHNFIVTVPGTGYRFVAPVQRSDIPAAFARRSTPARGMIAATLLIGLAAFAAWHSRSIATPPAVRAYPLTTYPGFERNPALSPEGERVAFTWDGEKQDNFDIYVKAIGSGAPLRLTTSAAVDVSPAWSPDGSTIAFLRRLGEDRNEVLLIPAAGGPERKLAETRSDGQIRLPELAWSPDGHWLAVAHGEPQDFADSLFLISLRTGEKRRLTTVPKGPDGDTMPAFSPDGKSIAFIRVSSRSGGELYLLRLTASFEADGEPQRLTTRVVAASPAWSPDQHHILYLVTQGPDSSRGLRSFALPGYQNPGMPLLEDDISELSLGRRLVYSRETFDTNVWRAEIRPAGDPLAVPQRLISSTRRESHVRYSPDGTKIAFVSDRSGSREIWVADAEGLNPVQLTSFGGPYVGVVAWSPDGQSLIFHVRPEGQADIFTIPAAGGVPKRLTTHPSNDTLPSYSSDGRWIYFSSRRSGRYEIWKMPAKGGDPTQVTRSKGAGMPLESPDGKTLYYCDHLPEKGIWKMPSEGGEAEQVVSRYAAPFCALAVASRGIYYTAGPDSHNRYSVEFVDSSTGQRRSVAVSDRPLQTLSLSASPDERYVLYAEREQSGSDLMLIENFTGP